MGKISVIFKKSLSFLLEMIHPREQLWLHGRAKAGGKFQRIIDTWEDVLDVGLLQAEKTLVIQPNSEPLRNRDYRPILHEIRGIFGDEHLIFRSDANFEDVNGRRAAGVLESCRCEDSSDFCRRESIKYVMDSIKSPKAQAYLAKHRIRNPRVGLGIQNLVTGYFVPRPDLSGVVNSAFCSRIEVTMVESWGDELNKTRNYKYWVSYDRKSHVYTFTTNDPTQSSLTLKGTRAGGANHQLIDAARYVINAVLQLESKWGISGKKGIDLEFVMSEIGRPSSVVHVQNNELDIPVPFKVPIVKGRKLLESRGVVGHGVLESDEYIALMDVYADHSYSWATDALRRFNSEHRNYVLFVNDMGVSTVTCADVRDRGRRYLVPASLAEQRNMAFKETRIASLVDYDLISNAGAIVVLGVGERYSLFNEISGHASLLARSEGIKILFDNRGCSIKTLNRLFGGNMLDSEEGPKLCITAVCDQEKNRGQLYIHTG